MSINNEWLKKEFDNNLYEDLIRPFLKHPMGQRNLRKFAEEKTLQRAHNVGHMFYLIDKRFRPKFENPESLATYQEILDDLVVDIEKTIISIKDFPPKLEILEAKVTRGFDFFNATSAPWFGENLISIQSGVFFLSHTLSRATEISLSDALLGKNTNKLLAKILLKRYVKTSVGLTSKDHTRTFTPWRIIPFDDSLLHGIELFVVAHEYAHLLFSVYPIEDFNFTNWFDFGSVKLIESNEEIAADAFALLIVYHFYLDELDKMGLYGPSFLFKNLCLYENSDLLPLPIAHPTNMQRHEYIKSFIGQLFDTSSHSIMDQKIDEIWAKTNAKIYTKAKKLINREKELRPYLDEALRMVIADSKKKIEDDKKIQRNQGCANRGAAS